MDSISIGSGAVSFDISPYGVAPGEAVGKVTAIRVQDVKAGKWFNWGEGKWDKAPVITPGANNLYVAFWVVNEGGSGDLTLNVKDVEGVLATKKFSVPAGEGLGVEFTGDMPAKYYDVTVEVQPDDSIEFTVEPTEFEEEEGIPLWQIILIAGFVIIGVGGGLYIAYERGWKRRKIELERRA